MGGWQIVKFPDEDNMLEVVPSSWIFQDSEVFRCYWPNTISDSKIVSCIKSQQIPGADWKSHVAIILSKCPYDSFAVATQKAKKAQYTSGLESESDSDYGLLKRPRRRNPKYISSEDESPVKKTPRIKSPRFKMPTPPKPQYISSQEALARARSDKLSSVSRSVFPNPSSSQEKEDMSSTESLAGVKSNLGNNLDNQLSLSRSKPGTCSSQAVDGTSREGIPNFRDTSTDIFQSDPVLSEGRTSSTNTLRTPEVSTKASLVPNDFSEVIRLLHIINGRVAQNNKLMTAVLTHLSDVSKLNETDDNSLIEPNMSLTLPAKSDIELLELDSKMDDSALKTFLVKKLVQIGGGSLKDIVKRIFPRIVDDQVLQEYSWVGGKGKKKFSLLKICDVIKDVCKLNPNTKSLTEKAVEEVVAVFLTKASERCSRKLNKNTDKSTV